jgi:large subunit ribosomal protein L6
MSRLGKKPIAVPGTVKVAIADQKVTVTGPKGTLSYTVPEGVAIKQDKDQLELKQITTAREGSALWGLARAMVNNMVTGVTTGFKKELEIQGVGYQGSMQGKTKLVLRLGYSHPVEFTVPQGITCEIPADSKGTIIIITGIDKQLVGQAAATIRSFREPDAYLGKGIRTRGEQITLKEGKSVG